MNSVIKKIRLLAVGLAATVLLLASPSDAKSQYYTYPANFAATAAAAQSLAYYGFIQANFAYFLPFVAQQPYWKFDYGDSDTSEVDKPVIMRQPPVYRYDGDHPMGNKFRTGGLPEDMRKREAIMDSTGESFVATDSVDVFPLSYPYEIELDDYLAIRKKMIQTQIWDSTIARYDMSAALSGGDIAAYLSQATGLTIPLPPNPVIGIFGKPEISVNVSGEVNLRLGWRIDSQNLGTVSAFGQTQSSPMFHQDIRINVNAKVGDKLKFGTDWNTRRQFDHENTFKIGYEGEDDDIIKLVELGNVSLPLQSSLIGGGQALFGVRADFQFGPLYLKTILSQRRGERRFVDVQGGSSKQFFGLRAYEYAKNHFFIDEVYKDIYKEYFKYSTPVIPSNDTARKYRISGIEVWESEVDVRRGVTVSAEAVAYADLYPIRMKDGELYPDSLKRVPAVEGKVEKAWFGRLDTMRYKWDQNLGTVSINNMRPDRFYAVSYRVQNLDQDDDTDNLFYGTPSDFVSGEDTLILKLIYRPNLQPQFKTLWDRQMKNVYQINATNVNLDDTEIKIYYINQTNDSSDVLPGAPDKLVTILGVDQVTNGTGSAPPDGKFDMRPPFFDARWGEITFPSLEPFGEGLWDYFQKQQTPQIAAKYEYRDVYDTTYDAARRNTARDRFIIGGEVTGRSSNRINLGAFNLAPNSVKVTLDGVPLREFQDYIVDYYSGTLTIRNPRAMLPNANLKVEYEAHDLFSISTKTLAGIRADYIVHRSRKLNAGVGMTVMHYDQSAIIDRVRLGEEPVANTMIGMDGRLEWETPWITKALSSLPFYDTKAPSMITLQGEWAMVLPNPNKRISEVAEDNGEPVVYIDDFEGAQRKISLGLSAPQWSHCSPPADSSIAPSPELAVKYKGKAWWYQYFVPHVPMRDVWPERETYSGLSNINPLYIAFDEQTRGIYNNNPEFLDALNYPDGEIPDTAWSKRGENKRKIWGGMMRLFSAFNTNFDTENIEYIEIMMSPGAPHTTQMFIDIGQISEDVIPNGALNTEDGITDANPVPNGIIDPGEDVGIDMIPDEVEKDSTYYPYPLNLEDDPARDNFVFNWGERDANRDENSFLKYNNFEGNGTSQYKSESGQFPDTEVLNPNNGINVSTTNSYFSYEVDLNLDRENNPQIVGGQNNWYLFRIPIRDPDIRVGSPSFSNIQYIRVWFKGGFFRAAIADWSLVGSQWQRISNFQSGVSPEDSVLQVAFVNVFENSGPPDYYTMPPGVQAPREINNPDPNRDVKLNEQSLVVKVKNLRYGEKRMAVRIFRPLDIFYYKNLKFFLHGDGTMPSYNAPGQTPKAYAFIRFGIDSSNYYEYRRPLVRGWQSVDIDLQQLASIKQTRDSLAQFRRIEFPVQGEDSLAIFAIKGNPILTRVQFFGVGIENPEDRYPNELTTTMWVNELRLISPERSADWAGVANIDVKLADLGTINANIRHQKPNFHRLEERFGNRVNMTDWSVTMTGNLEKFAPESFSGMRIPITYTHAEYMENPVFVANSDINLEKAAETAKVYALDSLSMSQQEADSIYRAIIRRSQTLRIQDRWAITGFQFGIPVKHWTVDQTINKVTLGYSYSQEYLRSPLVEQRFDWIWKFDAKYAVQLGDLLSFEPWKWAGSIPLLKTYQSLEINLLPASFSTGLDLTRRRQTEKSRFLDYPSPVLREFTANRRAQFSWKFGQGGLLNPVIDYSFVTTSTLVPYEIDENGRQRSGSELASMVLLHDGKLLDLGQNNNHSQSVTINIEPVLPIGAVNNYLDLTGTYATTFNWNNPLQPDPSIHDKVKTASYNANLRFNAGFKLKSLADKWYGVTPEPRGRRPQSQPPDTTTKEKTPGGPLEGFADIFKIIFFDYEKIDITFNQMNNSVNPGVFGGTGFSNFWARGLTGRESQAIWGPSFPYQLGLVTSPHGYFKFRPAGSFPYFGFDTYDGLRPPEATLQDNFSQQTRLEARTSRPLWEGAKLDLNWGLELAFNKNQTVTTDEFGNPSYSNIMAMESFSRTYFMFPSVFGFNLFNNTIENVVNLYQDREADILGMAIDTVEKNRLMLLALSESFRDGLEAPSLLAGKLKQYMPALNWAIRWEGLEEWDIFQKIKATRVSVEHMYTSDYQESSQISDIGKSMQNQQVQYGFTPLLGVTMAFDEKELGGVLTATFRWQSTTSYQLTSAKRATISRQSSNEIQAQASYMMEGFEFDLLGISLENNLEYSLLMSFKQNKRATYDIFDYEDEEGRTLDGQAQVVIEPRIRYSMSQRVTASAFVRYEGTVTEGAASPGYSSTQIGIDLRISISGGR